MKKASFRSPPQSSFDRTNASAVSDPLMTVYRVILATTGQAIVCHGPQTDRVDGVGRALTISQIFTDTGPYKAQNPHEEVESHGDPLEIEITPMNDSTDVSLSYARDRRSRATVLTTITWSWQTSELIMNARRCALTYLWERSRRIDGVEDPSEDRHASPSNRHAPAAPANNEAGMR